MPQCPASLVAALAFAVVGTLAPARTLLHCGTWIDGLGDAPRKTMTVIVDGEKIVGVQAGYLAPTANDKVIDLKSATVTPGWIDCSIEPGKFSDLVAVPGDVLADIKLVSQVSFVMKNGTVYKQQ